MGFVKNSIAQIDTTTINKFTVYLFLVSQDSSKKEMALKYVADSTSTIEPYTLMIAGIALYAKGYKDSSMYWLYLGDIRARFLSSLYKQRPALALVFKIIAMSYQVFNEGYLRLYLRSAIWLLQFFMTAFTSTH